MHRFSTPGPPRLTIELRAGDVSIDTQDGQETTVDVQPRSRDAQALVEDTVVEQRGEDVVVIAPKRSHGLFARTPELRITVTAPTGTRLNVRTDSADVAARGSYGESRVTSGSGDLLVEHLTGSAQLRAGSGDVQVRSAQADITVGTGSGDMRLGVLGGAATLQTGSGDIEVESAAAALKVQTGSGDIRVRRADADVKAQTASGDVSIGRVQGGRVKAQAASGDLHVGVADGTPAWLDVKTLTGGVSNDLQSTDPVGAGEQHVRLELNTVSGDIEIVRA